MSYFVDPSNSEDRKRGIAVKPLIHQSTAVCNRRETLIVDTAQKMQLADGIGMYKAPIQVERSIRTFPKSNDDRIFNPPDAGLPKLNKKTNNYGPLPDNVLNKLRDTNEERKQEEMHKIFTSAPTIHLTSLMIGNSNKPHPVQQSGGVVGFSGLGCEDKKVNHSRLHPQLSHGSVAPLPPWLVEAHHHPTTNPPTIGGHPKKITTITLAASSLLWIHMYG